MKFLKIHPTLLINYMIKVLFRVEAFFICNNKILETFNILEAIQNILPLSQILSVATEMFLKNA